MRFGQDDWRELATTQGVISSDTSEFTSSGPRVYSHFGMGKFQEDNGKEFGPAGRAAASASRPSSTTHGRMHIDYTQGQPGC